MSDDSKKESELDYLKSIYSKLNNIEQGMYCIFVAIVFITFSLGFLLLKP